MLQMKTAAPATCYDWQPFGREMRYNKPLPAGFHARPCEGTLLIIPRDEPEATEETEALGEAWVCRANYRYCPGCGIVRDIGAERWIDEDEAQEIEAALGERGIPEGRNCPWCANHRGAMERLAEASDDDLDSEALREQGTNTL